MLRTSTRTLRCCAIQASSTSSTVCALSIPCHMPEGAPVGLMIAGLSGQDRKILGIGAAIESVLAKGGRAIHGQAFWDARA